MGGVTPYKVTGLVRRFLQTLESAGTPVHLPFVLAWLDYLAGYCMSNTEAEAHRSGATVVYGWLIWEDRRHSFIEGEFHSVVMGDGRLRDVTPRHDGDRRVLFAPDQIRVARRGDERTWDTWSNHKQVETRIVESTHKIQIRDAKSNVWK